MNRECLFALTLGLTLLTNWSVPSLCAAPLPPSVPERAPQEVFKKACEQIAALEGTSDLLKGVSRVKPVLVHDEQKRLKSAHLVFENNAVPPGKNPARAKDASKPFFYLSVELWTGSSQQPSAGLLEVQWQGQTYQVAVQVYGSDADLVKKVRQSVTEAISAPAPPQK